MGKIQQFGLLFGLLLIAIALTAGCSNTSSTATTPVPTTAPLGKYIAGDIIAKTAAATDEFYIILAYNPSTDAYSRALAYKSSDGSWHRHSVANNTLSRSLTEKLYPAKIAHVDLSSASIVTPTVATAVPTTYSGQGPEVTNITPGIGGKDTTVTLTISGSNFQNGATVKLLRGGSPTITGAAVSVSSSTITGTFDLTGASEGYYNLVVFDPDGRSVTVPGGFSVGQAAPIITGVSPNTGAIGATIGLTVNGQNFGDLSTVTISSGSQTLICTNPHTVSGSLNCNLQIPDGTPIGAWTVTVLNVDAQKTGTWTQTFQITNATA